MVSPFGTVSGARPPLRLTVDPAHGDVVRLSEGPLAVLNHVGVPHFIVVVVTAWHLDIEGVSPGCHGKLMMAGVLSVAVFLVLDHHHELLGLTCENKLAKMKGDMLCTIIKSV